MKRLIAGLAVLAVLLGLAACGSTVDKQGDSLKAVQGFVSAIEARNYGIACSYYAKEITPATQRVGTQMMSGQQICAMNFEFGEAQSLMFFGQPVFYGFKVNPVPLVSAAHKAPKNGYVYRVKFSQGTVYIAVQRDNKGVWRVVSIS